MILADTSVWIDHLRGSPKAKILSTLLMEQQIISHTWVIAELALGHLGSQRKNFLKDLERLSALSEFPFSEIISFVERGKLFGSGLSLVDVQIFYSSLAENHQLWTHDKALKLLADSYGIGFSGQLD